MSKFEVGDKVVLLPGAKSNGSFEGSEYSSPEGLIEVLKKHDIAFDSEFIVVEELDPEGEVGICVDVVEDYFYIKPEFLQHVSEYEVDVNLPQDVDIDKIVNKMRAGLYSNERVIDETVTVEKVLEAGEFLGVDLEVLKKVVKLAGRLK